GDEFGLEVILKTERPVNGINTRWVLPSGVELVQGAMTGFDQELSTDRELRFRVQLRQVSSVNERIHFKASASHSGMKSSFTLQYNSIDQEEIDRKSRNLRQLASEQMKKDLAVQAIEKEKTVKSFKPAE
ncbi:MAG: hypothetical protein AAF202_09270, partial [Pseudomonadota bacterium]